jgi:hypothetical protein
MGSPQCYGAGNVQLGDDCSGGVCAPGLECIVAKAGPPAISFCQQLCNVDSDCSAMNTQCSAPLNANVHMCSVDCDPITNAGCPIAGTKCEIVREQDGQMRFYAECVASGGGKQGDPCKSTVDCAVGSSCYVVDANTNPPTAKCLESCDIGAPSCASGMSCYGWSGNDAHVVKNKTYGACE